MGTVDFYTVKSSLFTTFRSFTEGLNDLVNFLFRHGPTVAFSRTQ